MIDHLICARDENYKDRETLKSLKDSISECIKLLNGSIAFLNKMEIQHSAEESELYYHPKPNS